MNAQEALTLHACVKTLAHFTGSLPEELENKINQAGVILASGPSEAIALLREVVEYNELSKLYQATYGNLFALYEAKPMPKPTRVVDDDDHSLNYFWENQLPPELSKLGEILQKPSPVDEIRNQQQESANKLPENRDRFDLVALELFG